MSFLLVPHAARTALLFLLASLAPSETPLTIARSSPTVQTAWRDLQQQAARIQDPLLRRETVDAISNPDTCIHSRAGLTPERKQAIIATLIAQSLLAAPDPAAVIDSVFPPVPGELTPCPHLPQPVYSAPGSTWHGHHSFPGGLVVHTSVNTTSAINLADNYLRVYGRDLPLDRDIMLAAPLWHDWAKSIVFQWNPDGSEFPELNFGGAGDSRTGSHHLLGLAELMARNLPAGLITTVACAHAAPVNGNESKVVNWLRTAAILAQVDPEARGYLKRDSAGALHLPVIRVEMVLHNISDSDFAFTGLAITAMEPQLAAIAPRFGFNATSREAVAVYNNNFRNVVFANLPAERLYIIYSTGGEAALLKEMEAIRSKLKK